MQLKIEQQGHSPIYVKTVFRTRLDGTETWTGVRIITPYGTACMTYAQFEEMCRKALETNDY